MRTAMAFVTAVAVVVASAGCSDDQPLTDEPTPSPETTTTTDDAGDTTPSSSVAEPATTAEIATTTVTEASTTTAETTTTTATEESTTTVETTTTIVAAEPWTRPPLDGEWVEVAAGEPWGPALVGGIDALPGGGYVAVTLTSPLAEIAERDGFPISTVMWSPDGVEWFDGDPERAIGRPERLAPPQFAVASDRVAVVDGTDFSDHVPLAIGDPRTASWDVVALDYTALEVHEVSLAASDDVVLVATYSAHVGPAGMMDVVTWVVDSTTGTSETGSFTVANRGDTGETGAPLVAWVDGRWILFASEDPLGPEGGEPSDTLWTSSDGLTWSQADLPSGLGEYYADGLVCSLAVGPMGVVAATCPIGFGLHSVDWYSADGLEWAKIPLSQTHEHGASLTAVGDYGFVIDGSAELVAADGSGVYQMSVPFDAWGGPAASSGDTLLVPTGAIFRGFWLYSPS